MVKVIKLYQCEECGQIYDSRNNWCSKKVAKECERNNPLFLYSKEQKVRVAIPGEYNSKDKNNLEKIAGIIIGRKRIHHSIGQKAGCEVPGHVNQYAVHITESKFEKGKYEKGIKVDVLETQIQYADLEFKMSCLMTDKKV